MPLLNQLHSTTVEEGSCVANYLQRINEITMQIISLEEEIFESRLVHIALNRLPQEYGLVQGLLVVDELPSFEKLRGMLLVTE